MYYYDDISNLFTMDDIGEISFMLFEGDLTQTPELIPTEYIEGLKSSFEDGLITDEADENYGKYKVEYKVTNEDNTKEYTKISYLNSPLLEGDKLVTKNGKVYHWHKMGKVVLDGSESWMTTFSNNVLFFYIPIESVQSAVINVYCDKINSILYDDNRFSKEGIFTSATRLYIRNNSFTTIEGLKKWLSENPTTVVYELASPYYELIDEYSNTILNIPSTVAHLTHTSAVPVKSTTFNRYVDELNVLEANTQYRVMFDCDTANVPFTLTLGGTSIEVTSVKGSHSLLITTPTELVDKNLVIDGIGRCTIDNIRVFKGDVEYGYFEGLRSGYEERKLENLALIDTLTIPRGTQWITPEIQELQPNTKYTIIAEAKSITKASVSLITGNGDGTNAVNWLISAGDRKGVFCIETTKPLQMGLWPEIDENIILEKFLVLEGDWTDNPPTYEEVMANEGKYAVKVKLDSNANYFGKGGRI